MNAKTLSNQLANRVMSLAQWLLPSGKRAGNYWQAGDAFGATGTSLYLHLAGERAGNWRDAATGEGGDLLDLIALQNGSTLFEAMTTAQALLGNGDLSPAGAQKAKIHARDTKKAAIGLWRHARPLMTDYGRHGQAYLQGRMIAPQHFTDLRFQQEAWVDVTNYADIPPDYPVVVRKDGRIIATLPAIIAAVRNDAGEMIAVHRTFLDLNEPMKARVAEPKRALGMITGGACWLRPQGGYLVIAEGLETAMSLGMAFPTAAIAAGITAHHMTVMNISARFNHVLIAADNDNAGRRAAGVLSSRLPGRRVITIASGRADFNDDLQSDGLDAMKSRIIRLAKSQLAKREDG